MSNEKISFEILDAEPHQCEYISFEIKSDTEFIKNCYVRLVKRISNSDTKTEGGEETLALIPINAPRIYDIPIPLSWPVSFESEVEYALELELEGEILFSEELFIVAPVFIYDFIYTIEHFYLFSERVIYSDLKTEKSVCWVEFEFEGDSDKVDLMMAFNYENNIKVMVCIAPGGVSAENPWQKEHFEVDYIDFSNIYIKRKMDEILEKYAEGYDVFPNDIENDVEEVYIMIEEANEKMFGGDYDTAFKLLKQAKEIKELPDIYFELGKCKIDSNYPLETCINDFQTANQMDPEAFPLFDSFLYIIESYAARGLHENAYEISKQAIDYSEESADDYFQVAMIFKTFNFTETAIEYFNKALSIDNTNPMFFKEMGDCYFNNGDLSGAEKFFEQAYELEAGDPEVEATTLLASVKFQAGDITKAQELAWEALHTAGAFMVCGMNISNPDFINIFDDKLWSAYIKKFPEMQDVKDGKEVFFGEEFPFSNGFFV